MSEAILQPELEQRFFRCGGWRVLLSTDEQEDRTFSKYLYVDCPGRGQFKPGRYFAGAAGTASDRQVRLVER